MCIQPYTETALGALQLRRRSHHYGLRSRVSQGFQEERRAQAPKRLRTSTALHAKIYALAHLRELRNHLPHATATNAIKYLSA